MGYHYLLKHEWVYTKTCPKFLTYITLFSSRELSISFQMARFLPCNNLVLCISALGETRLTSYFSDFPIAFQNDGSFPKLDQITKYFPLSAIHRQLLGINKRMFLTPFFKSMRLVLLHRKYTAKKVKKGSQNPNVLNTWNFTTTKTKIRFRKWRFTLKRERKNIQTSRFRHQGMIREFTSFKKIHLRKYWQN